MKKIITLYTVSATFRTMDKDGNTGLKTIYTDGKDVKTLEKLAQKELAKCGLIGIMVSDPEVKRESYSVKYEDVRKFGELKAKPVDDDADTDTVDA